MSQQTPLYDRHQNAGGRIVDFFGFLMPVSYGSGIQGEVQAVRTGAGLFDVSHMGEFFISGPKAGTFLQKLTINDVSRLEIGDAQYSAMCYSDGGIVDDLILYRRKNDFMMVVNASNIDKDFDWLHEHLTGDVTLHNRSDDFGLVALQGPNSRRILQSISAADIDLGFYSCREIRLADEEIILSRTGYTGELGFEIYGSESAVVKIWDALINTGEVTPAGLGARDVLRMEMKYALYGNDIDETTNPLEAGLGWITALDKGEFIGREALLKVKAEKPTRRLIVFEMLERGIPRQGYELRIDDQPVGIVTSGTQSPTLGKGIGLGYVQMGKHKSGQQLDVIIRNHPVPAVIVKPPFVKNTSLMS